jgi:SPP1 gp7 family putative phage head morphogenesis protein
MFDLAKFSESFFKGLRTVSATAVQDAGNAVWQSLGKDDPWKVAPAKVQEFVARRENRCKDIPDDVWERIRARLQESYDAGDSTDKIAAAIRAEFNAIEKGQARVIAITETGAAYGYGEHESQKDAGITKRRWLTSGNANVRESHAAAEGQVRGIDEPFDVGGAQLMYPGDENGPPEEVINCHCVAVAEIGEKE